VLAFLLAAPAVGQDTRPSPPPAGLGAPVAASASPAAASSVAGPSMERLTGVWVEGPGFEITYGGTYESCAARCLANAKCAMIEFYRPERKCNLYDKVRPRLAGGSSIVGIRR
jgi:hypothetical protein